MVRGRKPIPATLKLLRGNPGKRKIEAAPVAPQGEFEPPDVLGGLALAEWRRVLPLLEAMRVVSPVDRAVLALYCKTWARWVEAEEVLNKTGAMIKGPNGGVLQNPYLAVANRANEQVHKLAVELGLTPSARSRVKTSEKPTNSGIQARRRA